MILRHLHGVLGLRWFPVDYEEVPVGAAAVGLTAAKLTNNHAVLVRFAAGPLRFRVDGVADPTASVGLEGTNPNERLLNTAEAGKLRAIRMGADNGLMQATYFRLMP